MWSMLVRPWKCVLVRRRESAIHAMRIIFKADKTDAALLVDGSNASNSLNRGAALKNIRVLCQLIATHVINICRAPARLFGVGGGELQSADETTQGDPLTMLMYAISLQPLISLIHNCSSAKQCWTIGWEKWRASHFYVGCFINVSLTIYSVLFQPQKQSPLTQQLNCLFNTT